MGDSMKYLKARNWEKFQHFKDRRPPWIKLYRDILDDYNYHCLPIESKAIAPLLWLMASESGKDGLIDGDIKVIAFRLRMSEKDTLKAINPLIEQGFFESDIKVISSRYQDDRPETEGYSKETYSKEAETNVIVIEESRAQEVLNQFDIFWQDFPTNGRNKGSKKDAEVKFKIALKKSTFNEIMQGVNNYATYIAQSGQSNQDAFRWLEKERWRDDYTITSRVEARKPTADDNCTAGIILALQEYAE